MQLKIFKSKFSGLAEPFWDDVEKLLPYKVLDAVEDCDRAVILGGFYENPSAFRKATVFYTRDVLFYMGHPDAQQAQYYKRRKKHYVEILKEYFDEMIDITGLTPKEVAERIGECIETYQP